MELVSNITANIISQTIFAMNMNWNRTKGLYLSNPLPDNPKRRKRKKRMSNAKMIAILASFCCNTFQSFKRRYLLFH